MCPRPHLSFCACKTTRMAPELLVSMVPSPHLLFFFAFKSGSSATELQVSKSPSPHLLFFCIHNSVIMTRINSLYGSQTSPVVVCMQNSAFSTGIASLNGSLPSSEVFPGNTATFGSELQVSMGPRLHLSFCGCKTTWLAPELLSLYGSQTTPVALCLQNWGGLGSIET